MSVKSVEKIVRTLFYMMENPQPFFNATAQTGLVALRRCQYALGLALIRTQTLVCWYSHIKALL